MSRLLEAYLVCHILILVSSAVVGRIDGRPRHRLVLARLLFLSCILAPIAMSFIHPAPGLNLGTSIPEREVARHAIETLSNAPPAATVMAAAKVVRPHLSEPWLWALFGMAWLWHLGGLARDLRRIRRALAASLALRAHGCVRLWVSEDCSVPFSFRSLQHAHIIVPASILLRPGALRIAIAHESEHHRQGDCVFAYLTELLRGIFYLNPGMHRWCRLLGEFQEYSCDEALIGRQRCSPHDYGRCLLEVVKAATRSPGSPGCRLTAASLSVGMGQDAASTSSLLRGRIMKLPDYQSVAPRNLGIGIAAFALAVGGPIGTAYGLRGTLTGAETSHLETRHLDPGVQAIAENEIQATLRRNHARSAAIVVADPVTGRILAFAQAHAASHGERAPESWATRRFFPGSTLKPFVVVAALDAGFTAKDRRYDNRSPYVVGGVPFTNNGHAATEATMRDTLVHSFNVSAIKIAEDLGPTRLQAAFRRFGLDAERPGADGYSDSLALARTTLGESLPVTMGTMVHAYATLANGGRVPGGDAQPATTAVSAESVRRMLVEVVKNGTGQRAALSAVAVAGKTRTVGSNDGAPDAPNFAMFAGFAPAKSPRIVAFALVEAAHAYGGQAAAPAFREIARRALDRRQ